MRIESLWRVALVCTLSVAVLSGAGKPPRSENSARSESDVDEPLSMSTAVACHEIKGYEDYEALPEAALTADEKLLVYYRPLHFQLEHKEGKYRAHLLQDAQIRRRGEKTVLQRKEKLLDYEPENDRPFHTLYLRNVISLKDLKPGDYELDIILHDKLGKGPDAEAKQALKFRVVKAVLPTPKEDAEASK